MTTEIWVVFLRQMRQLVRNPVWLVFGLVQPVLYLSLFGPLLENVQGGGLRGEDSWRIFVPGLLLQLAIFGAGFSGFGVIQELKEGVVDRQRVTPARRLSLLLGRTLSVVVTIGVQAVLLIAAALPFGLRPSSVGTAVAIVLVCVLSLGLAAASFALALILGDEDSFAPLVQGLSLPLLLLSGILLPMTLAPTWLLWVSRFNPLTYSVDGARALVRGDLASAEASIGLVAAAAMALALAWWGARQFQRNSA
jgi:ABC-2 type transport system permease protein